MKIQHVLSKISAGALVLTLTFTSINIPVAYAQESDSGSSEAVEIQTETQLNNETDIDSSSTEDQSETDLSIVQDPSVLETPDITEHTDADEILNEETSLNDKEVTTRLILTSTGVPSDYHGASQIDHYDDIYILSYITQDLADKAYAAFIAEGYTVDKDNTIDAIDENEKPDDTVKDEMTDTQVTDTIEDTSKTTDIVTLSEETVEEHQTIVAIIDTGISDIENDDIFKDKIIEGTSVISDSYIDDNGHGTMMAKIIAEETADQSNIKILPIKALDKDGKGTVLSVALGIKYAKEHGADVIDLSLSGIGTSNILTNAINDCYNNGITVVTAAGNDSTNAKDYMPGNIDTSINISAVETDINGNITYSSYTNYGDNIDFSAIGTYTLSVKNEDDVVETTVFGTSISAAYVSVYVSLLKQINSTVNDTVEVVSENDIYESLKVSAQDLGEEGFDKYYGNGYLTKENLQFKKSDKEDENKDTNLDETDERPNMDLFTQSGGQRHNWGEGDPNHEKWLFWYIDGSSSALRFSYYAAGNNDIYHPNNTFTFAQMKSAFSLANQTTWSGGGNAAYIVFKALMENGVVYDLYLMVPVGDANFVGGITCGANKNVYEINQVYGFTYSPGGVFSCSTSASGYTKGSNPGTVINTGWWHVINWYGGVLGNGLDNDVVVEPFSTFNAYDVAFYGGGGVYNKGDTNIVNCTFYSTGNGIIADTGGATNVSGTIFIAQAQRDFPYNGWNSAVWQKANSSGTVSVNNCAEHSSNYWIFINLEGTGTISLNNNTTNANPLIAGISVGDQCTQQLSISNGTYCATNPDNTDSAGLLINNGKMHYVLGGWFGGNGNGIKIQNGSVDMMGGIANGYVGVLVTSANSYALIENGSCTGNGNWLSSAVRVDDNGTAFCTGGSYSGATNGMGIWANSGNIVFAPYFDYNTYVNSNTDIRNLLNNGSWNAGNVVDHYRAYGIREGRITGTSCQANIYGNTHGIYVSSGTLNRYNYNGSMTYSNMVYSPTVHDNSGSGIELTNGYANLYKGLNVYNNKDGIKVSGGTLDLGNSDYTNNPTYIHNNTNGTLCSKGTLNLNGVLLYDNTDGVSNCYIDDSQPGGTTNIKTSSIYNNTTRGVYCDKGTVNIKNGFICNNNSADTSWATGCGVMNNGGTVNITGGDIRDNGWGNVWNNIGTLNISNGTIREIANYDKVSSYGVWNNAICKITGGDFYGYTAKNSNNTASAIRNCSSMTIDGENVKIHDSYDGIYNEGTITIKNGSVYSNSEYGIFNKNTVTYTGGSIGDNTSYDVYQNGTYKMSGSASAYTKGVYLTSGKTIDIIGALTCEDGTIPVTIQRSPTNDAYVGRLVATCSYNKTKDASDAMLKKFSLKTLYTTSGRSAALRSGNGTNGSIGTIILSQVQYVTFNPNISSSKIFCTIPEKVDFYWKENPAIPANKKSVASVNGVTLNSLYNIGWNTENTGNTDTGEYHVNTSSFTLNTKYGQDVTLYGVWDTDMNILFDGNGQTKGENFAINHFTRSSKLPANRPPFEKTTVIQKYDESQDKDVDKEVPNSFQGWSFRKDTMYKDSDCYKSGSSIRTDQILINEINNDKAKIDKDGYVTITSYVVWDMYPVIYAPYKYFNIDEINNGALTTAELLRTATVQDKEDGSEDNTNKNDKISIEVVDFDENDMSSFTCLGDLGYCTVTYKAVDGAGNITYDTTRVYVCANDIIKGDHESDNYFYNRHINEEFYEAGLNVEDKSTSHDVGGFYEDSVWYNNSEYQKAIETAFSNLKNDTPIMTYEFDVDDMLASKEYVSTNGIGKIKKENGLENWMKQFFNNKTYHAEAYQTKESDKAKALKEYLNKETKLCVSVYGDK